MKISDLIKQLEKYKEKYGDIRVCGEAQMELELYVFGSTKGQYLLIN